jgi:quercetin dioxygenase-like cupin family protein
MLACAAAFNTTVGGAQESPPGYVEVLPTAIDWRPSPVPGLHVANLLGSPPEPGPFVIRVTLLPGARVMPHTHTQPSTYTVLAGEWTIGFGETFDAARLRRFPSGSRYRLPAAVPHFHAAGAAETVVQIESIGPRAMEFIAHDPQASDPIHEQRAVPP